MKTAKKTMWAAVSLLMVTSLVIASCGPAAVTEEATGQGAVFQGSEGPRYGGTITIIQTTDPSGFDPRVVQTNFCPSLQVTHDTLMAGDWTKGPAGTGETDWQFGFQGRTDLWTGQLAASWEVPDNETIVYHIRHGVKWQNKEPANGRELTAEDVAWSITSEWSTEGSNFDVYFKKEDHLISATATDRYTVELKVPSQAMGTQILENGERCFIHCPDVTAEYGDQNDWRHNVTTGPFVLTGYTPGSALTYERNPDYWEKDPVGPGKGNQLPYVDGFKQLIISDLSTQLAAFRTAKIDLMKSVAWEDAEQLMKQVPELQYVQSYGTNAIPCGRVDKDLPFNDIKVRQALNLAVNQQEIVDSYYQGHADLMGWPFYPCKAHEPFFTPLEEMPTTPTAAGSGAGAQELYTYNPDKARQLLADAGYPNGFKTRIDCQSGTQPDLLAIIREYLLDVGVDMEIIPHEPSIYNGIVTGRTQDEMVVRNQVMYFLPFMVHEVRADSAGDASFWEDAQSLAVWATINQNLGRNDAAWVNQLRDVTPHLIEESWGIWVPVPYIYHMWWPWMKDYHGEVTTGYARFNTYSRYIWIDTDLKKSMGY